MVFNPLFNKDGIPNNWNIVKLGDVSHYISRGKQPKYVEKSEIFTLNQKAIQWGKIEKQHFKYQNPEVKVSSNHFIRKNDVVLNSTGTGTVGRVFHFSEEIDTPLFADSHVTIIRVDENKLLPRYLMYQLSDPRYQEYILNNFVTGSTNQVELNKSKVQELSILLPPLDRQKKAVEVLSALDKKIDLNNKIISTLETLSQLLFKHWFVDFEFPDENGEPYFSSGGDMVESNLGKIPKNWEVKSLIDIMDYQGGSQPPASEFIDVKKDGYIRLIQIRDYDTEKHLTFIPDTKKLKKCTKLDIMIARYGAALGRILFGLNGSYNVALAKVIPNSPHYREFLRNYLKSADFYNRINGMGERSAQAGFNKSDIKSFKVPFPVNENILKEFNTTASQTVELVLSKREEIQRLLELKSSLLPKLLSGELELPEEIEVIDHVSVQ